MGANRSCSDENNDATATVDAVRVLRRRLLTATVKYLPITIALILLGCVGVELLLQLPARSSGFALGWIIAGYGGASGTFAVCASAMLARAAAERQQTHRLRQAVMITRVAQSLIALAAAAAVTVTFRNAPAGLDRHFVIYLNGAIGTSLGVLALISNDVGRAVKRCYPRPHR